ncbi:MAG TPA: branched-chain amino acid ABC transporter permease, partial [Spirochaetia bacterium]|nr:branched-chain amino acid ABC transporter permease [Spirochaetia bacterium]
MDFALQLVISFLMLNCMYTLVAVGFTMYVGVINLANFSHGDTCVIGAYVLMPLFILVSDLGWIPSLSAIAVPLLIVITVAVTGLWGIVIYRIVINPLFKS